MQKEYINFMNKRVLYLSQGDADTPVQAYYSVLVENIPAKVSNYTTHWIIIYITDCIMLYYIMFYYTV